VLRQVISTYPLLNTVEILTAAGKLISKVKGQSGESSPPSASFGVMTQTSVYRRPFLRRVDAFQI